MKFLKKKSQAFLRSININFYNTAYDISNKNILF